MSTSDNIKGYIENIKRNAERIKKVIRIMEVCGTHTVSIHRSGIRELLPENVKLISGPGCPVCVTPAGYIDELINLAREKNNIITTYGDMIRVPGSESSLADERADGADVRVVTSAFDAFKLACEHSDKQIIFAAVGFETTTPPTADVLIRGYESGLTNFSALCAHKLVIPALQALLDSGKCAIDGFLCPGHVSVIIGSDAYRTITERYHKPCVVGGFEPVQIISAIDRIISQLVENRCEVENVYSVAVKSDGQRYALDLIENVFEPADSNWRALGIIPKSGLRIRKKYSDFDAESKFGVKIKDVPEPKGCRCGEVIQGLIEPTDCSLFGKSCNPERPVGPCMVSSEGACQAWFKYGKIS